jgi:hypothetical protein
MSRGWKSAEESGAALSRAYRVNLNMLALVALFTGGFLVFSAQALEVARRRGEHALLRVLGLTRGALARLVLAKARSWARSARRSGSRSATPSRPRRCALRAATSAPECSAGCRRNRFRALAALGYLGRGRRGGARGRAAARAGCGALGAGAGAQGGRRAAHARAHAVGAARRAARRRRACSRSRRRSASCRRGLRRRSAACSWAASC